MIDSLKKDISPVKIPKPMLEEDDMLDDSSVSDDMTAVVKER